MTLDRQTQAQFTSLTDRLNNAQSKLNEREAERVSGAAAKSAARQSRSVAHERSREEEPPVAKEEARGEAVDYGTPASSVSPSPRDRRKSPEHREEEEGRAERPRGSDPPPEPADPPRAEAPGDRRRSRSRNRGRRGGSRHQGTYRGLYEPGKEFHQRVELPPVNLGWSGRRRKHHERR